MTETDTDTAEIERAWKDRFAHYFELEKSDTALCGVKNWPGSILVERPTKPKCPICEALLLDRWNL